MKGKKAKQIRRLIRQITGLESSSPRFRKLYKGAKKQV